MCHDMERYEKLFQERRKPLPVVVAVSSKVEAERLKRKARRLARELIRSKRRKRRGSYA